MPDNKSLRVNLKAANEMLIVNPILHYSHPFWLKGVKQITFVKLQSTCFILVEVCLSGCL